MWVNKQQIHAMGMHQAKLEGLWWKHKSGKLAAVPDAGHIEESVYRYKQQHRVKGVVYSIDFVQQKVTVDLIGYTPTPRLDTCPLGRLNTSSQELHIAEVQYRPDRTRIVLLAGKMSEVAPSTWTIHVDGSYRDRRGAYGVHFSAPGFISRSISGQIQHCLSSTHAEIEALRVAVEVLQHCKISALLLSDSTAACAWLQQQRCAEHIQVQHVSRETNKQAHRLAYHALQQMFSSS